MHERYNLYWYCFGVLFDSRIHNKIILLPYYETMIKMEIHLEPDSDPTRSSINIVNNNDIQDEGSASRTVVSHGSVVENMNDNVDEDDNYE
jgi:hypothetical protein